jgi:hypothetical protein
MIRIVFMTSLAGLFSAAAMNYAAAQLDCSSRDIACTANCQMLPPELSVGCQTYCFEDREECDRTVERARLNEKTLLEEQQRRRQEKKLRRQPSPTSKKRTGESR